MFTGSTPDRALLDAAAAGSLKASGITEHAARLAAEPRFAERALDFHERWMQLDELKSLTKDPLAYPDFSPELVDSMRAETRRFIEEVALTQGGTVTALLTSRIGYVDARLAAVYGLAGSFGSELTEVLHDEEVRPSGPLHASFVPLGTQLEQHRHLTDPAWRIPVAPLGLHRNRRPACGRTNAGTGAITGGAHPHHSSVLRVEDVDDRLCRLSPVHQSIGVCL